MQPTQESRVVCRILLAILILILALPRLARPAQVSANLDDVAKAVESFFPKVTGTVTAIQGEEVTFNLGRESGISPGLVLTVFRPGKEFTHPVTGEPLGRFEVVLGRVEVTKVDQKESTGILVAASPGIVAGDSIRLTATRILLVVQPGPSKASQAVAEDFQTALQETGRFRLASKGVEASDASSDPVRSAGARGIEYLVKLDAQSGEHSLSFKMTLISTPRGTEIGHLEAQMEPSSKSDLTLENIQNYLLLQAK